MTTYQKYWDSEIESLLGDLNAPDSLRVNIVDTLKSKRSGIFPHQIINALRIGISIKENNKNTAFVASMQSGKSGSINFLCNYVLPALGLIRDRQSVLFVTSMRDTDLYNQNCKTLEDRYYDASLDQWMPSKLEVIKMSSFFNHPNPHKVVNKFNVPLIIRDEDQYGCGEESSFKVAFFDELRSRLENIKLLAVSATPYDILDAQYSGQAEVEVIEGDRPEEYYGISEMLRDGLVEDIPENFRPLQSQRVNGRNVYNVHPKVEEYIEHLNTFEDGFGVIRESNTIRASELRRLLIQKYKKDCKVILIGSTSTCDFGINNGIKEVSDLVLKRGKRVILVVVQALTAGKDLGGLKEKVRFGIEPRDRQLANGAQGITGRFCGYHKNRDFKLMASLDLLEHYSKFEQDPEIFTDPEWRNGLFNGRITGLSTQTRLTQSQSEGIFIPVEDIDFISYDELKTPKGRSKLLFIEDQAYDRLLSFFQPEFFEGGSKGTRFKQKDVTVRIASGYNPNSNRVYKNWNCDLNSDFGSIFFKKKDYSYGLLISNYPENHVGNTIGKTGVKIIKSGQREWRNQETLVQNNSMYSEDQVA